MTRITRFGMLGRYWHTLRHLQPIQFYGRLWFRLARPRPDLSPAPERRPSREPWHIVALRDPSLLAPGKFEFLGESGTLREVGWEGSQREKLWRYNQHYFDDLNASDASWRRTWHLALLENWVQCNPPSSAAVGWEPYPTSLRIVNWVKWAMAGNGLPAPCLHSLAVQTRWLMKRLEIHLLGNHLFANAKALVFSGMFFSGPEADAWLRGGLRIIQRELPRQVLSDGGNYERSTMYHAIFLEDLLDLINACRTWPDSVDHESISSWHVAALRMLDWLQQMSHPDGKISFFNDAAFGVAPTAAQLTDYASGLGVRACASGAVMVDRVRSDLKSRYLEESGYVRLNCGAAVAILDVAPLGPDFLPAHGHADTLSWELSLFGKRVLVNSGTSCYGASAERLRQRGTAAHNTLVVDGKNSSEVWGGFRVARRANPVVEAFEPVEGGVRVRARHDGYSRPFRLRIHTRQWMFQDANLRVDDEVSGQFAEASAYLHVHPAIRFERRGDALEANVSDGGTVRVRFENARSVSVQDSSWHPMFGASIANQCIVVQLSGRQLSTHITWGEA